MTRWVSLFGSLAIVVAVVQPVPAGSLSFTVEVSSPPGELPLLRLTPTAPPVSLVDRLLSQSSAPAKLAPLGGTALFRRNRLKAPGDVLGVVEDEHVRAWVSRKTGDAAIYPTLGKLDQLTSADAESSAARARELFESPDFIPRDDTRVVTDKPNTLNGLTLVRNPDGSTRTDKEKAQYLAYFSARRFVGDLPVDGPGSRALVAVGRRGSVEGLIRVWKSAKTMQTVKASRSPDQVRAEISRQLRPALAYSDVSIDRVELAYYDANRTYLQPVYRFTARIHHLTMPQTPPRTDDDFVIGYVPLGRAFEPLPVLGQVGGPQPSKPAARPKPPRPGATGRSSNDPTVGRYVVRNDDSGWVNDANAFWNSLASTWTAPLFTNSQYYWAEQRLFTTERNSFINAMNLALIEVHGDWWLFSTLQNCCDLVNINGDIPNPGYGPSAKGSLADWIIHSCEVVPGPDDTSTWANPWWTIFGGVRNVVGYRTIMYISDGAGGPYGSSLGNLAPVVSSWLGDVISLNAYAGHPTAAAHGGVTRPMGRPSTVSFCGHDNDSVLSTSSLGRANCLTVWWFPD